MKMFLPLLLAAATALAPAAHARQDDAVTPAEQAVDAAVRQGADFLLASQLPDGSIAVSDRHRTAMTALATLALVAVGHQPADDSPQGAAIRDAIDYLLDPERIEASGYYGDRDGSRMYGHGIVTLLLGELAGMGVDAEQDRLIRERLQAAIELILRSQRVEQKMRIDRGGWRYMPNSSDSDLSVTVWQAMALRSARAAGVEVPAEAIDEAVGYLRRSFRAEGDDESVGRFGYRPQAPLSQFTFSTTSAGLLALQVCGAYDDPAVEASADWLLGQPLRLGGRWSYYGTYYYAQGMYQRGGQHATLARERVEAALLAAQLDNGSWRGLSSEGDPIYATSMALLSLSVRYHYLPIYQR